jgi:hypothetical protein
MLWVQECVCVCVCARTYSSVLNQIKYDISDMWFSPKSSDIYLNTKIFCILSTETINKQIKFTLLAYISLN